MSTPTGGFDAVVASDPTRPRLTWYDDADGPTRGERIELSGRVLANWVAKAANLLTDELGVERGDVVALDLPVHWRGVYWALAVWRIGAVVSLEPDALAVVVVTDQPQSVAQTSTRRVVAVSLPALARGWVGEPLDGALDESADLLSQPDVFEPFDEVDDDDAALSAGGRTLTVAELASLLAERANALTGPRPRVGMSAARGLRLASPAGSDLLLAVLAAWGSDGSVVLCRDGDAAALAERWRAERVTQS